MDRIARMARAISHRGPDDEGYHISGPLALGFRRLSIIDLAGGHQPMSNADRSVWVVFNGEIYNYRELRAQLSARGHVFQTSSDTEVIVHGYVEWGEDVVSHLNGMFGFAIWDEKAKKLLLARDRMGIKPLYYMLDHLSVLFGSEIRAVLAGREGHPEIDPEAICLFLQHRYIPAPFTLLKGVRKLSPGMRLVVQAGRAPRVERWWKYSPAPFDPMPKDEDAAEQLLALYEQAVRRQLVSDVPVGLLLSGGLDSGLLLALMKKFGADWPTYSVGYGQAYANDELSEAASTARHFGVRNVEIRLSRQEFEATLDRVADILEEPVTASSVVPMYHLCGRARSEVTVALMGQGPDELFGGYARHVGTAYGGAWRRVPALVRRLLSVPLSRLPRNEAIKRALSSLDTDDRLERYQRILSIVAREKILALFQEGQVMESGGSIRRYWEEDLLPLMNATDELGGLQFIEMRSALPEELLMYADKISMSHGLEIRVPYLDHDIVEFAERLSCSLKIRRGSGKWIHKRAASSILPPRIVKRRKLGFESDVDGWLRESLSGTMQGIFSDKNSLIFSYLKQQPVAALLQEHRTRQADNSKILFSLVLLEHTLQKYLRPS